MNIWQRTILKLQKKHQIRARFFVSVCAYVSLFSACSIDNAKNRLILAERLWNNGNYEASALEFDKVFEKDSHGKLGEQALFRSAMTRFLYLSQYREAIEKFQRFIEITKDKELKWDAQKLIGEILYEKLESHDESIAYYRTLLSKVSQNTDNSSSDLPLFYYRIGRSYFLSSQFDDSIAVLQTLLQKYPRSPLAEQALFDIGFTYYTLGDRRPKSVTYEKAIETFRKFVRIFPNSLKVPEALFWIGASYEEMDQLAEALKIYKMVEKTYPSPKVVAIRKARIEERQAQRNR